MVKRGGGALQECNTCIMKIQIIVPTLKVDRPICASEKKCISFKMGEVLEIRRCVRDLRWECACTHW